MVDLDGRTEYTNMIMVRTGAAQQITASSVFNPFVKKLEVTLAPAVNTSSAIREAGGHEWPDSKKRRYLPRLAGNNKLILSGLSELNKGFVRWKYQPAKKNGCKKF